MGRAVAIAGALLCGCATGDAPDLTGQAFDGGMSADGMSSTMGMTTMADEDSASPPPPGDTGEPATDDGPGDGPPMPPDQGMCQNDNDCMLPAGFCLQIQGQCLGGVCQHGPVVAGTECDDGDPCTETDVCDDEGVCSGAVIDCNAPNAAGGECVAGMCTEPECVDGFADCNADMSDGCEIPLGTSSNCGGCGDVCSAGANASASCNGTTCAYSCTAPWENCDGNWANGCEIPVGVPHQCDQNGLNAGTGCWTAYCGESAAADVNFGTFHCIGCATCREPGAGICQWCNHSTGVFYPTDSCACSAEHEDAACS